jgi:mannitol-1-phosphate 5-dehydrogenase
MSDVKHVLAGFGFGPIQAGLFAKEARESGHFSEIAISEVDPALVTAVRGNGDRYVVNVAYADRVECVQVEGVTLLNPNAADDLKRLRDVLGRATEIVTSLPSVAFFGRGGELSVAALIAEGLRVRGAAGTVIYTAENNNHAAEMLEQAVKAVSADSISQRPVSYLNTVIGKMSQVVNDPDEIARRGLVPIAPGFPRAFLVESFNRILVSRIRLSGFTPGISAFEEKDDLLPFEEAKLYGHNAIHTLLGFLGEACGLPVLADLRARPEVIELARTAFLSEAGDALMARHSRLNDPLFTPEGFRLYADDLLLRMTNPHLADTVARAVRDPLRKLGCSDRLFGAMRLCLDCGIEPACLGVGALAGLQALSAHPDRPQSAIFDALRQGRVLSCGEFEALLAVLWGEGASLGERVRIGGVLERAQLRLRMLTSRELH